MTIGFFDSGIGGLTVLSRALKLLPNENFLYYADTDHVPYGEKTVEEVKHLVFDAFDFMVRQGIKVAVIACNTATGAALHDLRRKYHFPIIGIEPAVKPAVTQAHQAGKRVLVLATALTLKQEPFHRLVATYDIENSVDGLPMPGLVSFAEKFEFGEEVVLPYLQEQFAPYDWKQYKEVVLGCTHFPLFADLLRKVLPAHVELVDGGIGTAKNLKNRLEAEGLSGGGMGQVAYYRSGIKVEDAKTLDRFACIYQRMERMDCFF